MTQEGKNNLAWGDLREVVRKNAIDTDSRLEAAEAVDADNRLTALEGVEVSTLTAQSADPADPAAGESVIWLSDGTGTGNAGDLMIKTTIGETTKTGTVIAFADMV